MEDPYDRLNRSDPEAGARHPSDTTHQQEASLENTTPGPVARPHRPVGTARRTRPSTSVYLAYPLGGEGGVPSNPVTPLKARSGMPPRPSCARRDLRQSTGPCPPFGYDCVGSALILNEEAMLVRWIYEMLVHGEEPATVAEKMVGTAVHRSGMPWPWSAREIIELVAMTVYAGLAYTPWKGRYPLLGVTPAVPRRIIAHVP